MAKKITITQREDGLWQLRADGITDWRELVKTLFEAMVSAQKYVLGWTEIDILGILPDMAESYRNCRLY